MVSEKGRGAAAGFDMVKFQIKIKIKPSHKKEQVQKRRSSKIKHQK